MIESFSVAARRSLRTVPFFFVFFEELVEQHRVDLLVADAVGFSFFIHSNKAGFILATSLSNQTKFGRVGRVVLVVEGQ